MALTVKCPVCKKDFIINSIDTIEETYYATMDCKNQDCQALLYGHEKIGIIPFHQYIHEETNGIWDKDGKNTGYKDI